jgi:hypothetical protein
MNNEYIIFLIILVLTNSFGVIIAFMGWRLYLNERNHNHQITLSLMKLTEDVRLTLDTVTANVLAKK